MSKPLHLSLIAAIGKNRELGRDNKLVFDLKKDMAHFKEKTTGHTVIMGRKTFESIGRALPDRVNIVISRDKEFKSHHDIKIVSSVEQALELARRHEEEEVFVIGGAQIYEAFLPFADRLYLTIVDREVKDADAFFPEYENEFKKIISSRSDSESSIRFTFMELER